MVVFIPEYVVKHMNMNHVIEHRNHIMKKFPLKDGFEELQYGDTGNVYCRYEGEDTEVKIDHWDDFNFQVFLKFNNGLVAGCNPILWMKKK